MAVAHLDGTAFSVEGDGEQCEPGDGADGWARFSWAAVWANSRKAPKKAVPEPKPKPKSATTVAASSRVVDGIRSAGRVTNVPMTRDGDLRTSLLPVDGDRLVSRHSEGVERSESLVTPPGHAAASRSHPARRPPARKALSKNS
ncbi:hypothetical protein AB0A81_24690, partial [Streptomyces flaveolus]|uniref:hypothetical protein n=1 Tax=Streptomyces flaveolus TaxID=67297 RepID=UPI0033D1DD55